MQFKREILRTLILCAILAIYLLILKPRADIPLHLLNHKIIYTPNFIPEDVGARLRDLLKSMKVYPTNAADTQFYQVAHEHIGEAIPSVNGKCDHPFLVPSLDKSLCVLPGRIDVGRHYMLTGGPEGLKESYELALARVQSFGRYMFNITDYPVAQDLFGSPRFQEVAKAICPADQQYLDPFQFNFIMQVPGQTVATHTDAPYFWGATRFQFPQWLLASMVFSGLFQDEFVHQVQVVGYLHEWQPDSLEEGNSDTFTPSASSSTAVASFRLQRPESWIPAVSNLYEARIKPLSKLAKKWVSDKGISRTKRQGEFIYWESPTSEPLREPPTPLAGSAVDGSKFVHAAAIYRPGSNPPIMDKSASNRLEYQGSDKWKVMSNDRELQTYDTTDLRISIVYRARCFANPEEAQVYKVLSSAQNQEEYKKLRDSISSDVLQKVSRRRPLHSQFTLEQVLSKLVAEMLRKDVISHDFADKALKTADELGDKEFADTRLKLALTIMDTFIQYPKASLSNSLLPYNYCLLSRMYPNLKSVVDIVCPSA